MSGEQTTIDDYANMTPEAIDDLEDSQALEEMAGTFLGKLKKNRQSCERQSTI